MRFHCTTDGRGEIYVPHLQWHGRRIEIIQRKDQNKSHGSAARKEKAVRLHNYYERQIGRVQHFTTQQSISWHISFSTDSHNFRALQL